MAATKTPAEILAIHPDMALLAEFALIELVGGTQAAYLRARRSEHGMPRVSRKTLNEAFAQWSKPSRGFTLNTPFIQRAPYKG